MTASTGRQNKIFIGSIVLVHIVFFLIACHYKRIYMGDSYEYIYEALNIKDLFFFYSGNPALPISPEYMTQRQPGYPLLLLGVYFFTINNWLVLVLQNVLSIINLTYTRKILLRLGYIPKYDWLLLLLVIAYPSQFINANTIAPDILLQCCVVGYFGSFVHLFQSKHLKPAIAMSVWLIAGMLVKPVLYPFVLVHVVVLIVLFIRWHIKLQRIVIVALMPLCAAALYEYSNYARTGKYHYSSNQAFNAIYYYYPFISATSGIDSANNFLQHERAVIANLPDFKDRYDYANDRGTQLLKENLFPYLLFHVKSSMAIFINPGKAEMDLFTGKLTYGKLYSKKSEGFFAAFKSKGVSGLSGYFEQNPAMPLVILVLIFNCLRTIGILLFLRRKDIDWQLRVFVAILLGYFAVAAGPIANTRYFIPVSLVAIGCATLGYVSVFQKNSRVSS